MPYAGVNGVELYYEVHGQGDWLVLVHEFSGCYKSWEPQLEAFAREFRVLVYSCRGVEQPFLGGFSMGGSIALNYGLAYPDRVRALILAGTGTGSADKAQFQREFGPIADRLEREGPRKVAEDYLRSPTRIQLLRKNPAMWRKLHDDFVQLSATGLAHTLRGVQLRRPTMYELEDGMQELRVPTLVIVGDEDTPAVDASRFLAARIPNATLAVLPATGHTLNLEEPERFNAAVLEFLRRR